MNRISDADVRLAHGVDRALAEQSAPRAPADLQARVFATIEQRAARPWWRRRVSEWPLPARAAFAAAGVTLLGLLLAPLTGLLAGPALTPDATGIDAALAHHAPLYHAGVDALDTFSHTFSALVDSVPRPLLHAGLALGALLYLALFGLLTALLRLTPAASRPR